MVRWTARVTVAIVLSLCLQARDAGARSASAGEALVTSLDGTAQSSTKQRAVGQPLKKGDSLGRDQEVRVGERSRIEIRFPDGTVMRLAERSRLSMNEIVYDTKTGRRDVKVHLGIGKLWANVKKLVTRDSSVEVRTINAVAGVRGTIYRVDVSDDASAKVRVYDGSVSVANPPRDSSRTVNDSLAPREVSGPHEVPPPFHEVSVEEWTAIVKAMQQITISPQGVPSKPESFDAGADADDWVGWNRQRDSLVDF